MLRNRDENMHLSLLAFMSEGQTMTSGSQNTLENLPPWEDSLEEVMKMNAHFLSGEEP